MAIALDRIPSIVQSPNALTQLGALAAHMGGGAPVLLVADPGLADLGIIDRATASLRAAGLSVSLATDIRSDPTIAQVDAIAALARRDGAGVVVALGGGSAMDAGKAAAAITGADASAAVYALAVRPFPAHRPRLVCVPTTAGTGSETTRVAVLSDAEGTKLWLWGDALKPDAVLLDPVLTVGLPAPLTAATGIDALVHAIEACTNANANPASDLFCLEAIRLVTRHLPTAVARPDDIEARGQVQWAACLAGIGIDTAGTAIAHNIGHALASLRPIHHGRAVGLAMRATLPWNAAHDPNGRFAAVAEAMGAGHSAAALPAAYERLVHIVGLPAGLAEEGAPISAEALAAQMARPENAAMRQSNHRPVSEADLLSFARDVLALA